VTPTEIHNLLGSSEIGPDDRESIEVTDPARPGQVVARFPAATAQDVEAAVAASAGAARRWAALPQPRRADVLRVAADLLEARPWAEVLCRENGKTINEARGEVARTIQILRYYAGEGAQPMGTTVPSTNPKTVLLTFRKPLGTVAVVTPWNFPMAIPAWKIAPALVYGNPVVLKPSGLAPTSAWALVEALRDAGLPEGVLTFVTGRSSDIGPVLTGSTDVTALSFTGSSQVGRALQAEVVARGGKVQLELGGSNPTIVLDDAPIDRAVDIALGAAMRMAGQKCTATSRAIVAASRFDEFRDRVVARAAEIRVGDPLDAGTYMGPLITEAARAEVLDAVARGAADGGRLLTGGETIPGEGWFMQPTVFDSVAPDSFLGQAEVFGPIMSLFPAPDDEAAVALANGTEFGLSASIVTNDLSRAMHLASTVQAGVIKVNSESAGLEYQVPFGGTKASSSFSREQGKAAVEFFTETSTVYVDPLEAP
jgi:acyl-CoA reductase-like NAD-dependent aldehyde dehydrogenase